MHAESRITVTSSANVIAERSRKSRAEDGLSDLALSLCSGLFSFCIIELSNLTMADGGWIKIISALYRVSVSASILDNLFGSLPDVAFNFTSLSGALVVDP